MSNLQQSLLIFTLHSDDFDHPLRGNNHFRNEGMKNSHDSQTSTTRALLRLEGTMNLVGGREGGEGGREGGEGVEGGEGGLLYIF